MAACIVAFQEVTGASQASPLVDKQLRLVLDTVEHEYGAALRQGPIPCGGVVGVGQAA